MGKARPRARRRQRWASRRIVFFGRWGRVPWLLLALVCLLVGGYLVRDPVRGVADPPPAEASVLAFFSPGEDFTDESWFVSVHVRARGCRNPARVIVKAVPSNRWWNRQGYRLRGPQPITFMTNTPSTHGLELGFASDDSRPRGAATALRPQEDPFPDFAFPEVEARPAPLRLSQKPVEHLSPQGDPLGQHPIVSRTIVVRGWQKNGAGVIATFEADLVKRRSFGTCYVVSPAVVGQRIHEFVGDNVVERDSPHGSYGPGFWYPTAQVGVAGLVVDGADLDTDASVPEPNKLSAGSPPQWSCKTRAFDDDPRLDRATDRWLSGIATEEARNCAVRAVFEEHDAVSGANFRIFFAGLLLSLGLTLLVELGLGEARSSEPKEPVEASRRGRRPAPRKRRRPRRRRKRAA